ncbi:hypothetical protein FPOAC2_14248 [Fusarium poae]
MQYGSRDRVSSSMNGAEITDAVKDSVTVVQNNLRTKECITTLGANTEGKDTDTRTDPGTQQTTTVSPTPPPPSASPSQPPSPELDGDDGVNRIDITAPSPPDDKERQRKSTRDSVAERATKIHSQLTEDEKLNDDTIHIVSEAFKPKRWLFWRSGCFRGNLSRLSSDTNRRSPSQLAI